MQLLICGILGIYFVREVRKSDRTTADTISVINNYILLVLVLAFPLFVLWFGCFKSHELMKKAKLDRRERYH